MPPNEALPPLEPIRATAAATGRVGSSQTEEDKAAFLVRLAAGLAHEIKNPLSTMAINLALLDEEWGGARRAPGAPEPGARELRCLKRVGTLQREVRRLEAIVEDFLRFARGGQINRAPADLCALVREVLEFVE